MTILICRAEFKFVIKFILHLELILQAAIAISSQLSLVYDQLLSDVLILGAGDFFYKIIVLTHFFAILPVLSQFVINCLLGCCWPLDILALASIVRI